uniref:Uncharacterized protein n=1 Tax=Serratia marcescens BIDMC 80 TaxID=1445864 RepID=A0A4P3ANG1_SERMA|nr:TPA_exp: hypothetical protein [Serratia marcescens BIDMC 80]
MNTLADRYYRDTHYPIPHADFLRLQHAHATGVLFLDLLDTLWTPSTSADIAPMPCNRHRLPRLLPC